MWDMDHRLNFHNFQTALAVCTEVTSHYLVEMDQKTRQAMFSFSSTPKVQWSFSKPYNLLFFSKLKKRFFYSLASCVIYREKWCKWNKIIFFFNKGTRLIWSNCSMLLSVPEAVRGNCQAGAATWVICGQEHGHANCVRSYMWPVGSGGQAFELLVNT